MRHFNVGIALALLFSGPHLHSQTMTCRSSEACISWRAPTQYIDGTSIAQGTAITYRIYRRTNGIMTALPNTTAGLAMKLIDQPRGEQCYAVSAIIGGTESALSAIGCKMIRFSGPTDGRIERPTDGSIEPR